MRLGQRRRHRGDADVDIDLVPVMNMFLVLIPFLLASSSFLNLKSINASVPVKAPTAEVVMKESDKKNKDIKITAVVKLDSNGIAVSAMSGELDGEALEQLDAKIEGKKLNSDTLLNSFAKSLQNIKSQYPKSDTIILMPEKSVVFESMVAVMDAARMLDGNKLFPHVVVSSEVK